MLANLSVHRNTKLKIGHNIFSPYLEVEFWNKFVMFVTFNLLICFKFLKTKSGEKMKSLC